MRRWLLETPIFDFLNLLSDHVLLVEQHIVNLINRIQMEDATKGGDNTARIVKRLATDSLREKLQNMDWVFYHIKSIFKRSGEAAHHYLREEGEKFAAIRDAHTFFALLDSTFDAYLDQRVIASILGMSIRLPGV